jgi:hypothetical protein
LAAGLKDRMSTALYFGDFAKPDGMILSQRQDALRRLPQLDLAQLISIRVPPAARRTLALLAAVCAFLVYRVYYQPPMLALLEATANSHLVQSVLAPLTRAGEKEVQRTATVQNQDLDAADAGKRAVEAKESPEDPWQGGAEDRPDKEAPDQEGLSEQQDPTAKGSPTDQAPENAPTLSDSLLQALKDMMKGQQPPSQANQQSQQGPPRQADPTQSQDNDQQRDSQDQQPDSQEKSAQNASGAGDQQPGTKERVKNTPLQVKAVPERVALESTVVKDQLKIRSTAGAGTSQIATSNVSPQTAAVANGAEQEDIPARYRSYVQKYFQHATEGDAQQQ